MKYEIMMSILFELLSKKTVSATYLANKYEVSVRSIYRYIESIEQAGVPLYTTRGNGGGISIIDTYRLSSTFLTVKEYEQVINALIGIAKNVPNKDLENALTKIQSVTRNEYSGFELKSGNLIIDAGPWGDAVGYKSKLAIISKAIDECSVIKIKYHDRNGSVSERDIEPHVMVFKQGIWYVYAYCRLRQTFRFFKIGRIEYANDNKEKFIKRDIHEKDLPLDFWHNSVKTCDIVLEISEKYLSDAEEWLGIENVKKESGKNIARVKLPDDDGLINKILSFGSGIKVVFPKTVKEKVENSAKELLSIYSKN